MLSEILNDVKLTLKKHNFEIDPSINEEDSKSSKSFQFINKNDKKRVFVKILALPPEFTDKVEDESVNLLAEEVKLSFF